ncbi:MAG: dUTP diphosphatase, partial [Burkholderiaceae bacterium]
MTTTFIMPSGEIVQDAMPVQCRRVVPWAKLPEYATPGSACFDLFAACTVVDVDFCALIDTGLEFAVPDGHVMMIYSRSGHGFKHGVRLSNCVGVIDSDYR